MLQAGFLLSRLKETRDWEVDEAWGDLKQRGKGWVERVMRGRDALERVMPELDVGTWLVI